MIFRQPIQSCQNLQAETSLQKKTREKNFAHWWNLSSWTSQHWKHGSHLSTILSYSIKKGQKVDEQLGVYFSSLWAYACVLEKGKIKVLILQFQMTKFCALFMSAPSKSESAKLIKCEGQNWNYFWTPKPTFFQIVSTIKKWSTGKDNTETRKWLVTNQQSTI